MQSQMGRSWLFIAILILAFWGGVSCSPRHEKSGNSVSLEDDSLSNSIINGTLVPTNHPIARSTVAVYDNQRKVICTGSLLKNNLVLTAAHCMNSNPRNLFIVFETDFSSSAPEKIRQYKMNQVIGGMASPVWKYQEQLFKNQGDIALLKFYGSVPRGYTPAPLLSDFNVLKRGVPVIVAGYGRSDLANPLKIRVLLQTTLFLLDPNFSDLEISMDQTKGRGACLGDSGGPSYVYISGTYYLWGVISRGYSTKNEDHCDSQGIATKINVFFTWIQKAGAELDKIKK